MARTDRARPQGGRRQYLGTHQSDTREIARRFNRGDRRAARVQLRRDPESVELRQPRGRAIWEAV